MIRFCSSARNIADARHIHAEILKSGLACDKRVVDQLIQMYGNVGSVADARAVFEQFTATTKEPPDAFLWTAIISAFSKCGDVPAAKSMFDHMPHPKHPVPTNAMLTAFAKNGNLEEMWQFFYETRGRSIYSWDTVLSAFCNPLHVDFMERVFLKMPMWNNVSWNTVIVAYAQAGHLSQAKLVFDSSLERSIVSWNAMAKAFLIGSDIDSCIKIFDHMPQHNRVSWTATFSARVDHLPLDEIKTFFDRMPVREAGSWTVIIVRYSHSSHKKTEVLQLLDRMPQWNVVSLNAALHSRSSYDLESALAMFSQLPERDPITWNVILGALARLGFLDQAREMFDRMPQWHLACFNTLCHGLLGRDPQQIKDIFDSAPEHNAATSTTMIVAYAHSGHLGEAEALFDSMPQRTDMTWNAMIAAYARNWCPRDAKLAFDLMPQWSIDSWNSILAALARNNRVGEARGVFDAMEERNPAAWNTIIAVYAQSNRVDQALTMFDSMKLEGIQPDEATFSVILSAGEVEAMWQNWRLMEEYGVARGREHFQCAVDVLSRAGMIEEADGEVLLGDAAALEGRRESVGVLLLAAES